MLCRTLRTLKGLTTTPENKATLSLRNLAIASSKPSTATVVVDPSSTSQSLRHSAETLNDDSKVKSFDKIPGPRGPFGLGNLYKYLPVIGQYSWQQLHKASEDKYLKYGHIVRETIVPGTDIVWLFEPEDIALVLNEREFPRRRSHLALAKYRQDRPHLYKTGGLLPTNGPDWWRLRSQLQKEISTPRQVRSFLQDIDGVTQEFLQSLPTDKSLDILPELARLNLELTCFVTFGQRLHAFSEAEHQPESRTSRLIRAAEDTNSSILPTDQGLQLWRLIDTPSYRRLLKAQEFMESCCLEMIAAIDSRSSSAMNRNSLIAECRKNSDLDESDIMGVAADLLLAGIDTTSYTTAFGLYYLAKDVRAQNRLHAEAKQVLPDGSQHTVVSNATLDSAVPYTRAVLKEVFRLNPISVGVGRILNRDLVLSGYHVPKGTVVVTQNMVACRLEKHFKEPLVFNPDRWMQRNSLVSPYLVLPFGHGMRACIARRLAEQNILCFLLRLLRQYKLTWADDDKPLDVRTLLINKPNRPVKIKLEKR